MWKPDDSETITEVHSLKRHVIEARILDTDPGHGREVRDLVSETALYQIRGDLRSEVLTWLQEQATSGKIDLLSSSMAGKIVNKYSPLSVFVWQQLNDATAEHVAGGKGRRTAGLARRLRRKADMFEIVAEPTEQAWQRLKHAGGDADANLAVYWKTLELENDDLDWIELLDRASTSGNPYLTVYIARQVFSEPGSYDLVHAPDLEPIYRRAAEVLAENWQELAGEDPGYVADYFGAAIWGDEIWEKYQQTGEVGPPSGGGTIPAEMGCVNAAVAARWTGAELGWFAKQVSVTAAPEENLVRVAEMHANQVRLDLPQTQKLYRDIIWRLTAAGRNGEWLWENLPLDVVYRTAETWTVGRIAAAAAAGGHIMNLVDGWQGTGAELVACA